MPVESAIKKLRDRQDLSAARMREVFDAIFAGAVPETQIADLLIALHDKGETADEILGAVQSMRARAVTIQAPPNAIDIVGTGGDGRHTLNISTAAALVVAACGVPVAKHGNRAATSKSGSSDVLAALGIRLEPSLRQLEQCLAQAGICFLFAPRHHPSMRHVADVRRKLGVRTLFNLLGPLTNPAQVAYHLIGVYDAKWLRPMGTVLQSLHSRVAWIMHGRDGLDEISISAASDIVEMTPATLRAFDVSPENFGISPAPPDALRGGDAAYNAAALKAVLQGATGAYRDSIVVNAAAALEIAGEAKNLAEAANMARQALDSGAALRTLEILIAVSNKDG